MWLAGAAVLALIGLGVEDRLHRGELVVAGTDAAEAQDLAREHFGESSSLVVMLEGPRRELDRQGQRLAEQLGARADFTTLGPWVPGTSDELRPGPRSALVLVRVDNEFERVSEKAVPLVRADVRRLIEEPVEGYVTGYPDIAQGIHEASVDALRRAELIAAPLLLLVLLFVFRSPVAAALPLLLGLATIAAARGVIDLANRAVELDVVSLNLASMMGLALGVDYSLVMVSRFREELAAGRERHEAVGVVGATAGRTVLYAGVALVVAMAGGYFVSPGSILQSAGVGVVVAALLSVVGAMAALPAVLTLLGPGIDRWTFGEGRAEKSRFGAVALRAVRRPAIATAAVLALLALLAAPSTAIDVGPVGPEALPSGSEQRKDFEHIVDTLGGGWSAPYELIIAAERGPITGERRLRRLDRLQERLVGQPRVHAVLGPAPLTRGSRRIERFQRSFRSAERQVRRGRRDQRRLEEGLEDAGRGVDELRRGLAAAADGAAQLGQGGSEAAEGSRRLRAGLAAADRGAAALAEGLGRASSGADELLAGTGKLERAAGRLERGAGRLERGLAEARRRSSEAIPRVEELRERLRAGGRGLQQLREPVQRTEDDLRAAREALERMLPTSKLDPQWLLAYQAVLDAQGAVTGRHPLTGTRLRDDYEGLDAELGQASDGLGQAAEAVGELVAGMRELADGLRRLESGAGDLETGLGRLRTGADELLAGVRRLRRGLGELGSGGDELAAGLDALSGGALRLEEGVERLGSGATELAAGLDEGARESGRLDAGLERMSRGVTRARMRTGDLADQLGGDGGVDTAVFDSGYMLLAALDAARQPLRSASTFSVNLAEGGTATRIAVIQDGNPSNADNPLRDRLERAATELSDATGMEARVGGPAAILQDFDASASSRFWLLAATLVAATYLVLVPVLRSLLLPLFAVLLNLVTVAAAFGVLTLLFVEPGPLPGEQIDPIMVLAIFAIVFGLSIDYEVFLLMRMREGWALTGDTDDAIAYGLRRTAGVITGAALIMTGVFAAFASAEIANMRQLGIGLSVAVILDATLVRLVLLPALIRLAGRASWWLPFVGRSMG